MDTTAPTTDEIGRMYDESAELSQIFIDGQEHLPYWYDERDDTPVVVAAQRITRRVAESLGLRGGQHVLDAGCGVGAPAILLANEYGVRVTGITVSAAQATEAGRRADWSGVAGAVAFRHGDYMALDFPDGTFDAVMAIESLMHAPQLEPALAGFLRVLRPGGRLALADCTRESSMSDARAEQFTSAFRVGQLLSIPQWLDRLGAAGFEVQEYAQCGPRVYGMGLRYLDRADELHDDLVARFGAAMVTELKQSYRDYFGWGSDIGYAIITARRPYA